MGSSAVRPFAVESFGRLGEEVLAVLGEAWHRVAERVDRQAAGGVAERSFGFWPWRRSASRCCPFRASSSEAACVPLGEWRL